MNTATTARPVRIHIAIEDGPYNRIISQIIPIIGTDQPIITVGSIEEADLIIFSIVADFEYKLSPDKSYIFLVLPDSGEVPVFSNNCTIIKWGDGLQDSISKVIEDLCVRLGPSVGEHCMSKDGVVSPDPFALHILVIDDMPENIASAKSCLAGHHLTTVTGYQEAMDVLGREKFDVVLTDLYLPMSLQTMWDEFRLGELVPYGILLMVEAARQGAKHVAVVTDLSHHDDPFSAAFDHYSQFPVKIENAKVVMMHAPMRDGAKDWKTALDRLMKE